MDLRTNSDVKDHMANEAWRIGKIEVPSVFGQSEDLLDTPSEVERQAQEIIDATETPIAETPEVNEHQPTDPNVQNPQLRFKKPEKGQDYDEYNRHHTETFNPKKFEVTISREPNRWDTICNLQMPVNNPTQVWIPKIGMSSILVYNQSTSAGDVYVAPNKNRLVSATIRGKKLSAGDSLTISTEDGGWILAPNGATVDIVMTWYDLGQEEIP